MYRILTHVAKQKSPVPRSKSAVSVNDAITLLSRNIFLKPGPVSSNAGAPSFEDTIGFKKMFFDNNVIASFTDTADLDLELVILFAHELNSNKNTTIILEYLLFCR